MPKPRTPAARRQPGAAPVAAPTDLAEVLAFAVSALQMALAQAAPKEAPAIARQLVATAKEWEQAQARRRAREKEAAFDAACARKDREIVQMADALERLYPVKPAAWGQTSMRDIAEAMHEAGLMEEVLLMAAMADAGTEEAAAAPPPPPAPAPAPAPQPVSPRPRLHGPQPAAQAFKEMANDPEWAEFCAAIAAFEEMDREDEANDEDEEEDEEEDEDAPASPSTTWPPAAGPRPRLRTL